MNAALFRRQEELRRVGWHQRSVDSFLRESPRRERWLEIYRRNENGHRKIGYSGVAIEKRWPDEGLEYVVEVDMVIQDFLPTSGLLARALESWNRLAVIGQLRLDGTMRPLDLQVDLWIGIPSNSEERGTRSFALLGKREDESFHVRVMRGTSEMLAFEVPAVPMTLSDGLAPFIASGELREGQEFRIPVIDPLNPFSAEEEFATVRVLEARTEQLLGIPVDVWVVETDWHHTKIRSLVTRDGEVVRQELGPPMNIVLERASSRTVAIRGFEP